MSGYLTRAKEIQAFTFTPVCRATGTSDWSYGNGGAHGLVVAQRLPSGKFWLNVRVAIVLGSTGVSGGDGTWIVQGLPGIDALFPHEGIGASSDGIDTAIFVNASGTPGRSHYKAVAAVDSDLASLPRMAADVNHVFVPVTGVPFSNGITEYAASITPFNSSTATETPWDATTGAEGWSSGDQMRFGAMYPAAATSDFSQLTPY